MKLYKEVEPGWINPASMRDGEIAVVRHDTYEPSSVGSIIQRHGNIAIFLGHTSSFVWPNINNLNGTDLLVEVLTPGTLLEV